MTTIQQPEVVPACTAPAHRWRLEEQNGAPTVSGTCRHCGAVKHDFKTGENSYRQDDFTLGSHSPVATRLGLREVLA